MTKVMILILISKLLSIFNTHIIPTQGFIGTSKKNPCKSAQSVSSAYYCVSPKNLTNKNKIPRSARSAAGNLTC